jgi:hypothetical protein
VRPAARSPSPASRERGTKGVRAIQRACPFTLALGKTAPAAEIPCQAVVPLSAQWERGASLCQLQRWAEASLPHAIIPLVGSAEAQLQRWAEAPLPHAITPLFWSAEAQLQRWAEAPLPHAITPLFWSAEAQLQRQAEAPLPHAITPLFWSAEAQLQRQAEAPLPHAIIPLFWSAEASASAAGGSFASALHKPSLPRVGENYEQAHAACAVCSSRGIPHWVSFSHSWSGLTGLVR